MDVITILNSVNKISLGAFLIILAFLSYQFYLFKKETSKKNKIVVPDFTEDITKTLTNYTKIIKADDGEVIYKKKNFTIIIIGAVLTGTFGLIFFIGVFNSYLSTNRQVASPTPTSIINPVASHGIKIYNQNWTEMTEQQLSKLKSGESIFIGLETIVGSDINMARVRVNGDRWQTPHITVKFNKEKNVFYQEYMIATQESQLKIDAQLHSKTDGWLGD